MLITVAGLRNVAGRNSRGCNSMAPRPSDREPTAAVAHAYKYIYFSFSADAVPR